MDKYIRTTKIEELENKIHLKQLQIIGLLNITQAINNNIDSENLYKMYSSFMSWEMAVKKMALFFKIKNKWACVVQFGIPGNDINVSLVPDFSKFERVSTLEDQKNPLLKMFDVLLPVMHNDRTIAYLLMENKDRENESSYDRFQLISTITNIVAVAIDNKRLFEYQLEEERMNREMELASEMQMMLIPDKDQLPVNDEFEMSSIYLPQLGIGGDYYDCIQLDNEKTLFCVADISGKGIAAALLMSNFQSTLHYCVSKTSDLKILVSDLNEALFGITGGNRFLTMFLGIFDNKNKTIEYINAGHNPPLYVSKKGIIELKEGCTILGSFKELKEIGVGKIACNEEAMLIVFTDGLTDLQNENSTYFDEKILKEFAMNNMNHSAATFNSLLLNRMELYKGKRDFLDDFTVLTCKLKPKEIGKI